MLFRSGRPAVALEKEWGPPTREIPDQGQRLLIYEELDQKRGPVVAGPDHQRAQQNSAAAVQAQANATVNPKTFYVRSYRFWVDATGRIVRTATHEP